jgi:hypothetical protein
VACLFAAASTLGWDKGGLKVLMKSSVERDQWINKLDESTHDLSTNTPRTLHKQAR